MNDRGGDETQSPLLEDHEYSRDDYASPRSAPRPSRRRRSFVKPVIALVVIPLVVVSLAAIGISRLERDKLPKPAAQDETGPPPKEPERFSEQPVEPPEPFKSFVLDAAQSYLAGRQPAAAR